MLLPSSSTIVCSTSSPVLCKSILANVVSSEGSSMIFATLFCFFVTAVVFGVGVLVYDLVYVLDVLVREPLDARMLHAFLT